MKMHEISIRVALTVRGNMKVRGKFILYIRLSRQIQALFRLITDTDFETAVVSVIFT